MGGVLLMDSFHRFSGEKPDGLHQILVCGESPHGEIGWRRFCFVRWGLGAISVFWCVSSGLVCSPLDLMQDVMKSLPSFLIYCCYCL